MDNGKRVWVPHPTEGFKLGRIADIGSDGINVEPFDAPGTTISAPYDRVYPAEEYDNKDVDDNCALMFLNEATMLNNVRMRYMKNVIYTYVANILIAINPYFEIPALYSKECILSYQGKSLGMKPPHVFALADKAYRDMKAFRVSQSIVVSGESGAGKTETTKHILKYLTECYGAHAGPIEQRIVESNPLLEAFGNAKTMRNNNSSRFGKFVEIHFDAKALVTGGHISHYLLEKSRICMQNSEERNYHIFYRLCAGAPEDLFQKLHLAPPDQFNYLNRGNTQYFCTKDNEKKLGQNRKSRQYLKHGFLKDIQMDDQADFCRTDKAMTDMGLTANEKLAIYTLVAGVLHLGNINFVDHESNQGGCNVAADSIATLSTAAELLGLDKAKLEESLTSRITQAARGAAASSTLKIALRCEEAVSARDALAKSVYAKLFDYIVTRVNQALPFSSSQNYIGVLDIAGFEYFQRNSFEQFCINYCNEKLQQFFNERILKDEQVLYEKEGLGVKRIEYVDNQDCIDLIENRGIGLLDILDEESKLPKPSASHYTAECHAKNKGHFRFLFPRKSKLKVHREVRDDEGFLVRHFAGAVCYHTEHFIEKNNDALHASLMAIVSQSSSDVMKQLYQEEKSAAKHGSGTGKLSFISVGSKFRTQLSMLMEKLKSTGTNFIRCVKPNVKMVDHLYEGASVLSQLQCSGMTYVVELMQQGYPSRTRFDELYAMYNKLLTADLRKLDSRLFCKLLFQALGLNEKDFKFGLTKVFFRPGKFSEFDSLMRSDPEHLHELIKKVRRWLLHYRWRKAQYCALEVIKLRNKIAWRRMHLVKVQSTMRMWICVKKYRHRIKGLTQVQGLKTQVTSLYNIMSQLKTEQDKAKKAVDDLVSNIDALIKTIKTTNITASDIKSGHDKIFKSMESTLIDLKKKLDNQKQAEEAERLRKIQEEMERDRKRKEEEERKAREEEDARKLKAEMETRRKKEEEERRRQEDLDRKAADSLQKQLESEAAAEAQRLRDLEQERLDRELALRLAQEDQSAVEGLDVNSASGGGLTRGAAVIQARQQLANKKHDLSKWKYAELRDTINTSCDMELLAACREEFHRRLKVYHDWKQRNKGAKETGLSDARAPTAITQNGRPSSSRPTAAGEELLAAAGGSVAAKAGKTADPTGQRYFRIPFVRPNEMNRNDGANDLQGWWWAHFDGKWIARQMEIHPHRDTVILLAGVDDLAMCELALEETGLSRKKGAEILEDEFEAMWKQNKGEEYLRQNKARVSSKYLKQRSI